MWKVANLRGYSACRSPQATYSIPFFLFVFKAFGRIGSYCSNNLIAYSETGNYYGKEQCQNKRPDSKMNMKHEIGKVSLQHEY